MDWIKGPSGYFGLSNCRVAVPVADMGDLEQKQVWGRGGGVAIKSPALFGHVKFKMSLRPATGQNNWTARCTSLDLKGAGRAQNIIWELSSAGSVAQMPCWFSCLGFSHKHYKNSL